jgi:DNA-binding GntR family transcriptional regulator
MSNKIEEAYRYIKSKIMDNTYPPTHRLVESQLAEEIGTSRNTIRQSFLKLEREKLVVIVGNKGTYVKHFALEEVLNILEIRELLEGLITVSAVDNITDDEIDTLHQILMAMEQCIKDNRFDDYSEGNKKFHNVIYNASNKQEAVELVRTIKTQLVRHQFRTVLVAGRNLDSIKEHKEIFDALKRRNKEDAENAIRTHIRNVANTISQYYKFLI